jgi:hypothetical protein
MPPVLLALLAASVPPPVTTVWTPPPPGPHIFGMGSSLPATDFDVEVRAGHDLLWSGSMRVSGAQAASFSRQKSDAPPGDCPAGPIGYGGGERSALSITLASFRVDATNSRFRFTLNWERPGQSGQCAGAGSARTVGLSESFDLAPGQSRTLTGDGGLVVQLHRR